MGERLEKSSKCTMGLIESPPLPILGDTIPLIHRVAGSPVKNDAMRGGQIPRNEAYNQYAAMTNDEG